MKPKFLAFPLTLVLTSSAMAGNYDWKGTTDSTWITPSNWDIATTPPTSTDLYPIPGNTYASDQLRIVNGAGVGAVYNPGAGVTTTFNNGRCFVIGSGAVGNLTVTSGTIVGARTANVGSEPIMANASSSSLLINGGAVDLSGQLNTFYLVNNGAVGLTSDLTITSGSFSCNGMNIFNGSPNGASTINLEGTGLLALNSFSRTAAAGATATLNLNGGTLRARTATVNFLNDLTDTQAIVKTGGAKIETDVAITIAAPLLHDPALGVSLDGGLAKSGTAGLILSGTNTYNGGTTINGGSLIISSDANLGDAGGGLTFGASTNLNISASIASSNRVITLSTGVLGNIQLAAGVSYTNSGKVTGSGSLRFRRTGTGAARAATLASLSNDFTGSLTIDQQNTSEQIGVVVNSLSDPVGAGNIICTDLNTSTFPSFRLGVDAVAGLTLTNRRIELAGAMNTGSFFIVANDNITNPVIINSDLLVSGTAGTRRLSLSGVAGTVNEFAGDIADGVSSAVSVTKGSNAAVWTLSGNNSHTGGTTLGGGTVGSQLNINSPTALGTGTFSITGGDNGKINNTSGAPLTLSTNNAQAWSNNFAFVGTNSLNLGTGAVTMGGNRTIFAQGSTLTVGGAIGGAFGLTKASTGGTLVLTGSSSYTGGTVISGGTLSISSIADYGVNSAIGAPASGQIQLGAANNFCGLTYTGPSASTNRTVQLGDATAANTGVGSLKNNGTGALTFTATNFNPTITGITAGRTLWLGGTYSATPNEIQGVIQDNDVAGKVAVGKGNDASIWLLSGANTYTGGTVVQDGTLKLGAAASIASSSQVTLNAGATLDTSAKATYATGGQPLVFGIDATGSGSSGKITAAGLNVGSAVVTYSITGTPDDPAYVLATYTGTLTGTFASVPTPPLGYTLNYAYEGNKIALVQAAGSPYQTWAGSALFNDDANGDGVKNGLAWILGATDKDVSALNKLPTVATPTGYLTLAFKRVNPYAPAKLYIEYSNNLASWTKLEIPAASGTIPSSDVEVVVTPGTPDDVTVKIPTAHAAGGRLFGRLSSTEN